MKLKVIKTSSALLLSFLIIFSFIMGCADFLVPSRQSYYEDGSIKSYKFVTLEENDSLPCSAGESSYVKTKNMTAKLFGFLPLKNVSVNYYDKLSVFVGGFPFGVKFYTGGVLVVSTSEVVTENGSINPAEKAGLMSNDVITKCNGKDITEAKELTKMIENCEGNAIEVTYLRGGAEYTATLVPVISKEEGTYKTGMWIKDSGAGIGTVTYVLPEDNSFGGLGHGICDSKTGEVLPIGKGNLMDVNLNGIEKGEVGDPGELKGYFSGAKLGAVIKNTECGVFGIYNKKPKEAVRLCQIGLRSEIKSGKASVICTLDDSGPTEYEIEISAINSGAEKNSNKCFTVKITDPRLIEKTGGIVQGMSGSPILQNEKLIGAVTHVFVNDPTKGYGIFIENMLSAADTE